MWTQTLGEASSAAYMASIVGFGLVCYWQSKVCLNKALVPWNYQVVFFSCCKRQVNLHLMVFVVNQVEEKHVKFLTSIMAKHKVKDLGKAVRIAIQFVMEEKGQKEIVYTEVLCHTCGGKKNKQTISLGLYESQRAFLSNVTKEYKLKSVDVSVPPPPPHSLPLYFVLGLTLASDCRPL